MITVTVSDGTLASSRTFQLTVHAPTVIALDSQPLVFHVSARKVVAIDQSATLSNVDNPTLLFAGSVLTVSGQASKDTLSIIKQNGFSLKGKNLLFGKDVIGTVAPEGITGSSSVGSLPFVV